MNNEYSLRFSKSISNTAKGFLFCCVLFCFVFVYFVLFCCFCLFVCLFHTPQKLKWVMVAHKDIKTFEKMRNPKWRLRLSTTVIGWTYYFAGSSRYNRGHDFFWIFFKVTKTLLGVIHKGWGLKSFFDSPIRGVGLEQKLPKVFQWKLSFFLYDLLWGWPIIFMSKRGALKSKYSAVHSVFYCFASADICWHGLLHVATRVAYTNIRWPMRSNEVWMHN